MRTFLFSLFFFLFAVYANAQLQPAMPGISGIGGIGTDQVNSNVTPTQDGGFILSIGATAASGTGNIDSYCVLSGSRAVFAKYNSDYSVREWSKCSTSGSYIFPQSNGDFVFGGTTSAASAGWAFKILRETASGGALWYKKYGDGASAILRAMIASDDGGYIMLGEVNYTDTDVISHHGSSAEADLWILKVDANGNKVWSKVVGGTGHESAAALVSAPGNGCYVVGGTGSNDYDCTGNPGGGSAYVARLDDTGGILWHKCPGGSAHDAAAAACRSNKGGVVIAVNTSSSDNDVHNFHGGSDYWAVEIDSSGNIVWDNCYGTANYEVPQAICKASDGSIWMNGYTNDNFDDAYVVHADSAGNMLSVAAPGSNGQDRGQMIYPLSNGMVLVGGYYSASNGAFSSLTNYGYIDAFLAVFAPWTTSVQHNFASKKLFKIYPNPARQTLTVETQQRATYIITINDVVGKKVYSGTLRNGTHAIDIDISNFEKGVYNISISGDEANYIEKVVFE